MDASKNLELIVVKGGGGLAPKKGSPQHEDPALFVQYDVFADKPQILYKELLISMAEDMLIHFSFFYSGSVAQYV